MPEFLQFGELVFDESLQFARVGGEREVHFTRAERAVLGLFTRNVRKVLTRNQLLDAIEGMGSDDSDRRVDFLINRLREKLGDSARSPRVIATKYGEGYIWIAERKRRDAPERAFLLVGPVYGLDRSTPTSVPRRFLAFLTSDLDRMTAAGEAIVLAEDWRPGTVAPPGIRFSLDVSFHADQNGHHCAAVLREGAARQIVDTFRLIVDSDTAALDEAPRLAGSILSTIWRRLARSSSTPATPTATPLEIRMHDAALLLTQSEQSWIEMGAQLARDRAAAPDDPEIAVMWAMHLYAKLLFAGASATLEPGVRNAIEDEIEALAFSSLPGLGDHPLLMLGAAKLLFFVKRGHEVLATQLAETAFAQSTAFAASFSTLGQISMWRGDIGRAVELYDRGIELSEPGSMFHIYLQALKVTAQLAADDWDALAISCPALYAIQPESRYQVGFFAVRPDIASVDPDIAYLIESFDFDRTRLALTYLHYISARHFQAEANRENIMRGYLAHAVRRFGIEVVPEEVRVSVPRFFGSAG